jgi:hypothetical protein
VQGKKREQHDIALKHGFTRRTDVNAVMFCEAKKSSKKAPLVTAIPRTSKYTTNRHQES